MKKAIQTDQAPKALGPYSQAICAGKLVFLSGQIALDPNTNTLIADDISLQVKQVLQNLQSVCQQAGGTLNDVVKLTIYLTDLADFNIVNESMLQFFTAPFPARATIQVSALPRSAKVEMDAIMMLA